MSVRPESAGVRWSLADSGRTMWGSEKYWIIGRCHAVPTKIGASSAVADFVSCFRLTYGGVNYVPSNSSWP